MRSRALSLSTLLLAVLPAVGPAVSAPPPRADAGPETRAEAIRRGYAKFEHRIPMRDGARLFTAVYVPNDRSRSYPILLFRTPYGVGPYGADRYPGRLGPSREFEDDGFIFVAQDVRGRFMSEGEFVNMRPHVADKSGGGIDESTDTWDTIEWLLRHVPGHNGKVGQWGISYPGFYASAGMIDSHPALAAVSPQAPIADWFWDDMHHHGAFILPLAFNFFATFGQVRDGLVEEWPDRFDHGTEDGYQFFLDLGPVKNANARHLLGEIPFWNDLVAHPNYDGFWQSRRILPHLKGITAAVMVVGGWYDTEDLYGPLQTYRHIEDQNPGIENVLVMGPWPHGGWGRGDGRRLGEIDFGFDTAPDYRQRIELPFFRHHLKDGSDPRLPEATVFETGANRWRQFDAWPPAGLKTRSLYLREKGGLSFEPPTADGEEAADRFVSDPAKPVPYTMEITTRWARRYMTEDQRFAAWRPDVLVYRSEPLETDTTLAGPLRARLWVATTGQDADWVVKLIDVHPDVVPGLDDAAEDGEEGPDPALSGRQTLVRAEVFRGRFRDSYETPRPFTPGEVTEVAFDIPDILHTFKRGHRLMVQVQSTWFPFVDRNPQSWVESIYEADEDDFIAATHTVFRSGDRPSGLEVGVLPPATP